MLPLPGPVAIQPRVMAAFKRAVCLRGVATASEKAQPHHHAPGNPSFFLVHADALCQCNVVWISLCGNHLNLCLVFVKVSTPRCEDT